MQIIFKYELQFMALSMAKSLLVGRNIVTLHYITVFSAGPTTTRTGPAIQVSTIIPTTKTMNVKSRYVNVKKVSLQPATKRCDGIDSSQ